MKTLDEVITELEDEGVFPDALHYLKEYRSDKAMWEADRKGYLNWIEQYKEAREKHQQAVIELKKNPPLTWDELKAMKDKPVWVEYTRTSGIYRITFKGWMLIGYISEKLIRFIGTLAQYGFTGEKIVYGDKWNTYKKEHGDYECIVTDLVQDQRLKGL